jgi:fructokinase
MAGPADPRPVIFGEVLYDCFPDGSMVLGGAPFNVAWHLHAFGAAPLFISRVGDDPLGQRIRDTMQGWGMDTSGLQQDSVHPTGKVDITIEHGEPAYSILNNQAYDFIDVAALPPLPEQAVLYHGSLALRNSTSRQALQQLKQSDRPQVFIDVNLRAPWWQRDAVLALLEERAWIKLNEHELAQLVPQAGDTTARMRHLQEEYHLDLLIMTQGSAGAFIQLADGREFSVRPSSSIQFVDTVGAGDAFSSVLLLGLLRGWETQTLLARAQAFASAIVGVRGATVTDAGFYQSLTTEWQLS